MAGEIYIDIDLDFNISASPPVIELTQYSKVLLIIRANLYNGGTAYSIPSGASISLREGKPTNNGVIAEASFSGNVITCPLKDTCSTAYGDCFCCFEISTADGVLETPRFILRVAKNPVQYEDELDSDDFEALSQYKLEAAASAAAALASQNAAKTSETNAAASSTAAANSATAAAKSASAAAASEADALASETNAKTSENAAAASETNAAASEANAAASEAGAKTSEQAAAKSEANAKTSETNAAASETNAAASEQSALSAQAAAASSAESAQSWAVGGTGTRTGEDTDNSKYYAEQAATSEANALASETNAKEISDALTAQINHIAFEYDETDGGLNVIIFDDSEVTT